MIRVENVTKEFQDGTVALNRISFLVEKGEAVAIIGPSGAGKTTLFRALTRSINLDSGTIEINGVNLYALPYTKLKKMRGSIGLIYQQHNLAKELSVTTNVAAGLLGRLSTVGALRLLLMGPKLSLLDQVSACLDEMKIRDKILSRAGDLSGGEQQRVAVARLLMQDPDIILADEPIASVDPVSAERIMDTLTGFSKSRGKTLICNIHNIDVARNYFDRVLALQNGEIVFDGLPEKLSDRLLSFVYDREDSSSKEIWETQEDADKVCTTAGLTSAAHALCKKEGFCR